jgi:NAD(P)-dependent dehydrogenase (short-subunit alcohol dehydrogenase family)
MSLLCSGRVAIVTGAGRGIGREHALALAAHGAKVVVNDLGTSNDGVGSDETPAQEVVRTIKERGGEAVVNTDNVADFRGAKRMIDQAIDTYGTLDVLVNNAGILRDRVLVNMVEPEWDAVIEVHLKGTFAPSRHASAYWRNKSKEIDGPVNARIINTSSACSATPVRPTTARPRRESPRLPLSPPANCNVTASP